jgi:hypothetical protein
VSQCPVKIHWGASADTHTQCGKDEDHWDLRAGNNDPHEGPGLPQFPYQRISWLPGDRREYVGEWPGPCGAAPCTLHRGHLGRCAV